MSRFNPIGLFDSGFGGLTVLKEVRRLLPKENIVYFGDTANLPYGNKSSHKILQMSLENSAFLLKKNIKLLIVPCHTACTHALQTLQKMFPIPVIGVIEPCLQLVKPFSKIAILGTQSTIDSSLYQSLILKQNPSAELYPTACPLFVPLVEEGFQNHPAAHLIATTYLDPLLHKIDAALLGCTHYPLIQNAIKQTLGANVELLDPAKTCAAQVQSELFNLDLLNTQNEKPIYQFFSSNDPNKFQKLGEIFLGFKIDQIEAN